MMRIMDRHTAHRDADLAQELKTLLTLKLFEVAVSSRHPAAEPFDQALVNLHRRDALDRSHDQRACSLYSLALPFGEEVLERPERLARQLNADRWPSGAV